MQSGHEDRLQKAQDTEVILGNTCRFGLIQKPHVSIIPPFPSFNAASDVKSRPSWSSRVDVIELKNIFIPNCCFPPRDSTESDPTSDVLDEGKEGTEDVEIHDEDGVKEEVDL